MLGRAAGLVAGTCLLLLAAWGATSATTGALLSDGGTPGPATTAWPTPSDPWAGSAGPGWRATLATAELAPTGIELVNTSGIESMAVDGTGTVWVAGGWQLSRVDPTTGSARTWDVSDDAAFATLSAIRPTRGAGVWLVEDGRLRLFDGQRFARDLPVPAAYRGGDHGSISDVAEVGAEVWISSAAGVARSTPDGAWAMVGQGSIWQVGRLALDSAGNVWALGSVTPGGDSRHVLVRLDDGRWSPLAGIAAPRFAEEIVADPAGSVLIRLGPATRRFDGAQWQSIPALPAAAIPRTGAANSLAMGPDGAVWVAGIDGLHRYAAPSGWMRVAPPERRPILGLGTRDNDVLAVDGSGLLRLDGSELRRIWSAKGPGLGLPIEGVLAVGSDEIWATGDDAVLQLHDGHWRQRRSGLGWQASAWTEREAGARLALATDGAVWTITDGGLARFDGDEGVLVPRPRPDGWLLPGPDSGVWAVEAIWSGWTAWYAGGDSDRGTASLVRPDGTQLSIDLPGPAWSLTSLAAGTDGTIWATMCEREGFDYCTDPALMRWDGRWSHVPYPAAGISGVGVAPDGGFWALLTAGASVDETPTLARYLAGNWSTYPGLPRLQSMAGTPRGGVCGIDPSGPTLVCVDPTGQVGRRPVAVSGRLAIGPDGSLWVASRGVVARLPGTAPAAP